MYQRVSKSDYTVIKKWFTVYSLRFKVDRTIDSKL